MSTGSSSVRRHRGLIFAVVVLAVVAALQAGLLLRQYTAAWRSGRSGFALRWPWTSRHAVQPEAAPREEPGNAWAQYQPMDQVRQEIQRLFEQALQTPPHLSAINVSNAPGPAPMWDADPFARMRRMRDEIDALLARTLREPWPLPVPQWFDEGWTGLEVKPTMAVRDGRDAYEVTLNLPGAGRDQIHVRLNGSLLTVSAECRPQSGSGEPAPLHRFEQRFRLPAVPARTDAVKATYRDGVLTIVVPKDTLESAVETPIDVL